MEAAFWRLPIKRPSVIAALKQRTADSGMTFRFVAERRPAVASGAQRVPQWNDALRVPPCLQVS